MRLLVRHGRTVIVAFCLLGVAMATLALGGSPGRAATRDGRLHIVVVPRTTARRPRWRTRPRAGSPATRRSRSSRRPAPTSPRLVAGGRRRCATTCARSGSASARAIPTLARPSLLDKGGATRRVAGKGATGLAVVQYVGPIKDAWIAAVRQTGVEVVTYMAQNGAARVRRRRRARRARRAARRRPLRARGHPVHRGRQAPARPAAAPGARAVVITTVAGDAGAAARAAVRARVAPAPRRRDGRRLHPAARRARRRAPRRARRARRRRGDRAGQRAGAARRARGEIVAGNAQRPPSSRCSAAGYRSFLAAKGFSTDSPVTSSTSPTRASTRASSRCPAGSHPDFYRSARPANPSRIRYAQEATAADADARDCGGHGTNVASIATGYNAQTGAAVEDAQGFNYGLGVAPYAQARRDEDLQLRRRLRRHDVAHRAAQRGLRARRAHLQQLVGRDTSAARTTPIAQEFDALVRDAQPGVAGNQPMVEVFAAGNTAPGPTRSARRARRKNVITVGASENVRAIGATDGCGVTDAGANSARDIIDFSSRGPTDDGRIKPDIVAPGHPRDRRAAADRRRLQRQRHLQPAVPGRQHALLARLGHLAGGARGDAAARRCCASGTGGRSAAERATRARR